MNHARWRVSTVYASSNKNKEIHFWSSANGEGFAEDTWDKRISRFRTEGRKWWTVWLTEAVQHQDKIKDQTSNFFLAAVGRNTDSRRQQRDCKISVLISRMCACLLVFPGLTVLAQLCMIFLHSPILIGPRSGRGAGDDLLICWSQITCSTPWSVHTYSP